MNPASTNVDGDLSKSRANILAAFDDMRVGTEFLQQFIAEAERLHPAILAPHVVDAEGPPIESARLRWDFGYYSRQKCCTWRNFSRERLDHLLAVRKYLRQQQHKGFVPPPSTDQVSDMESIQSVQRPVGERYHYAPSDNLRRFIAEGEVSTIRGAIDFEVNDIRLDRKGLLDALAWIEANAGVAFVPHTEGGLYGAMSRDSAQWDVDYFDKQSVYLGRNFSVDRLRHLVDIRAHLRERGVKGFAAEPVQSASTRSATMPPSKGAATTGATSSNKASPAQPSPTQKTQQEPARPTSVFQLALLIGGALAAAVIYLTLGR